DKDNNPLVGVRVEFTVPAGAENGTLEAGDPTRITDAQGIATIVFTSGKIEGIISHRIPVTASVNDGKLMDEKTIYVVFEPAKIVGYVKKNGVAIPNAIVKLTKDFDGDGVIDFAAEART